jgi:hypothetical protein
MKTRIVVWMTIASALMVANAAGWTPLQTDFGPYLRIVSTNDDVYGLRLGLFSENKNVAGASVSFWSDTIDGSGGGLQLALWHNTVKGDFTGVQLALGGNETRGTFTGVGLSLFNMSRNIHGIVGGFGVSSERVVGAQLGVIAIAEKDVVGLQAGLTSGAYDIRGVQIGLFCRRF